MSQEETVTDWKILTEYDYMVEQRKVPWYWSKKKRTLRADRSKRATMQLSYILHNKLPVKIYNTMEIFFLLGRNALRADTPIFGVVHAILSYEQNDEIQIIYYDKLSNPAHTQYLRLRHPNTSFLQHMLSLSRTAHNALSSNVANRRLDARFFSYLN